VAAREKKSLGNCMGKAREGATGTIKCIVGAQWDTFGKMGKKEMRYFLIYICIIAGGLLAAAFKTNKS